MNKKGFTLIELLAVIVILAVIALILIPGINKIVDNSKKAAFKESVNNMISSAENYMSKYLLDTNGGEPSYPVTFICDGVSCSNGETALSFNGNVPQTGSIIIENKNTIKASYITNGKYCALGTKVNLQIVEDCSMIDDNAPTVTGTAKANKLNFTLIDNESGIDSYCITTTNSQTNCDWVATSESQIEQKVVAGTYYIFAKDKKGNVSESISLVAITSFADKIISSQPQIYTNPTLTKSFNNSSDAAGLYSFSVTNGFGGVTSGTTYAFRGNVSNNYVTFAGLTWRIVRINEDETIRLILADNIGSSKYIGNYSPMSANYYTNSTIKGVVDSWYETNIGNVEAYDSKVASGNYFCEALKVTDSGYSTGGYTPKYGSYVADLTCLEDGNHMGLFNGKAGLITYDEAVFAGAYAYVADSTHYLSRNYKWWLMTGVGINNQSGGARIWAFYDPDIKHPVADESNYVVPVINITADVSVTGSGTQLDPYIIG